MVHGDEYWGTGVYIRTRNLYRWEEECSFKNHFVCDVLVNGREWKERKEEVRGTHEVMGDFREWSQ